MRCVVQRVSSASVRVRDPGIPGTPGSSDPWPVHASIGRGLLVLVGLIVGDQPDAVDWMADKLGTLRVFEDDAGKMNLALADVGGAALLVPNFTLAADAAKGRRPSFDRAMRPEQARPMFESLAAALRGRGVPTGVGVFGADMRVELVNDGPVTLVIDAPQA